MRSFVQYIPNISQGALNRKIDTFLGELGETFPAWGRNGLCNGYAFMMMRADVLDERDKHIHRLCKLAAADEDQIKQWTTTLKNYHLLFEKSASELQEKLTKCQDEDERQALRKKHQEKIEQEWLNQATTLQKSQLAFVQELYVFINSLMSSFDPAGRLDLHIDDIAVNQDNYTDTLNLLPGDKLLSESKSHKTSPIKNALQFAFNFKESELIMTLKKIVREGDYIKLCSTNHAMYFTLRNGIYSFYDPNSKVGPLEFDTCEALVTEITNCFFGDEDKQFLPVGIHIFENAKSNSDPRPQSKEIIKDIFAMRDVEESHIDAQAWDGATSLWMAAKTGCSEVAKELLTRKANPELCMDRGFTPAYMAAQNGYADILAILVEHKANIHIPNKSGNSPALIAAQEGNLVALNILIKHGADLNHTNITGQTPLHAAALYGHDEVVDLLAKQGADLNKEDHDGDTPVILAARNGHSHVLQKLSKHKANLNKANKKGLSPVMEAIIQDHAHILEILAEQGTNLKVSIPIDKETLTSELAAVCFKNLSILKTLAKHKISLNKSNNQHDVLPIHLAAETGQLEMVQFLINIKVNINKKDKTKLSPLDYAAASGHADVVDLLIKNGANLQDRSTLALTAALNEHDSVLEVLKKHGITLEKEYLEKNQQKLLSTDKGINVLAKYGFPLNKKNQKGYTPAGSAAQTGNADIILALSKLKVDLNKRNKLGATPAFLAAREGHVKVLEALATCENVDFNLTNGAKCTPFFIAVINNKQDVIKFFLENRPEDVIHSLLLFKDDISDSLIEQLKNHRDALSKGFFKYISKISDPQQKESSLKELLAENSPLSKIFKNVFSYFKWSFDNSDPLEIMLVKGIDYLTSHANIIDLASKGQADVLEFLASHGVNLDQADKDDWTPAFKAAQQGHINVLMMLAKHGFNLDLTDKDGWRPVLTAAANGQLEVVKMMHKQGIEINKVNAKNGCAAIHRAAENGHADIVEFLIEHKENPNKKDSKGMTAAMHAAINGHSQILETLVNHGADLNQRDKQGRSILLMLAIENNKPSVIKFLATQGISVQGRDKEGLTYAAHAVEHNAVDALTALAEKKADLNQRSKNGETPAFIAATKGHISVLEKLSTMKNIDFNRPNKQGHTPFYAALKNNSLSVIRFFIKNKPEGVVHTLLSMKELEGTPIIQNLLRNNRKEISKAFYKVVRQIVDPVAQQQVIKDVVSRQNAFGKLFDNPPSPSLSLTQQFFKFFNPTSSNFKSPSDLKVDSRPRV